MRRLGTKAKVANPRDRVDMSNGGAGEAFVGTAASRWPQGLSHGTENVKGVGGSWVVVPALCVGKQHYVEQRVRSC